MIAIDYENDDFLFKRVVLEQLKYMTINVMIIKPGVEIYTKTIKNTEKKFKCFGLPNIKKGHLILNPLGRKGRGIYISPMEHDLDSIVFIYAQKSIKETLNILIHEFLHASIYITTSLGIKIDNPNDSEVQAYLQGYLFDCFYDDIIRITKL